MAGALSWYLALAAAGAACLYPAALLFGALPSRGVLYARPLALALLAYLAWLPGASGAGYGAWTAWAALAALAALSAALAWRRPELSRAIRSRRGLIWRGEALFLALYALLALVRSRAPDAAGTEKPMDLRLLSALDGAPGLPPGDPWFAGEPVSYYYLGHVAVDALAALSGTGVGAAFTLGVVTAGACAALACCGLATDLLGLRPGAPGPEAPGRARRAAPSLAAAVSAAALLWLAPLAGALELAGANGAGRGLIAALGVEGLPGPEGAGALVPDRFWWWWDATRLLPGVIAEFPAFSLLLGDLHAHLLALPLAVACAALAAADFAGRRPLAARRWLADPARLALAAALYAALAMTNSWDVLTWGALWLLAAAAAEAREGRAWPLALLDALRYLAPPALGALALALPFALALERPALGLALVADGGSEPLRFALFWLAPALAVALAALRVRPRAGRALLARGLGVACLPVAAWAAATLFTAGPGPLGERGSGWLTIAALVLAAGGAGALAARADREGRGAPAAALGLAAAAAGLVLLTELLFLEDAFGTRMNTVFKLWFHAWLLLALAAGVAWGAAASERGAAAPPAPAPAPGRRALARGAAALSACGLLVIFASLAYAPAAAVARAREGQVPSLDALAYLDRAAPGEAAAVRWARSELAPRGALMLEAVSPSYGSGNRVSAASGVPTLLGWPGHQLQWRRDPPLAELSALIGRVYAEGASEEVRRLLAARGVTHVYLGPEERRRRRRRSRSGGRRRLRRRPAPRTTRRWSCARRAGRNRRPSGGRSRGRAPRPSSCRGSWRRAGASRTARPDRAPRGWRGARRRGSPPAR